MNKYLIFLFAIIFFIFTNCTNQEHYIPKPPTYLELNFPSQTYSIYTDSCGYSYKKPSYFKVEKAKELPCNRTISFDSLNGEILLSYINMDTSLAAYVNYTLDEMDRHKVKATAIFDSTIIRDDSKVYGTFFELQGNVATPFQFYLTDSTSRFIRGVVYFNTVPNYDSIQPVLDFVEKDLFLFISTLSWDKNSTQ